MEINTLRIELKEPQMHRCDCGKDVTLWSAFLIFNKKDKIINTE